MVVMFRRVKNSQEYKSFDIYVVTIKISMTEYHHLINYLADGLFLTLQSMGENEYGISGHLYFHFFEALNNAFEVQCAIFQGFIFTPYHRHWYIYHALEVKQCLGRLY